MVPEQYDRRAFLGRASTALGTMALAAVPRGDALGAAPDGDRLEVHAAGRGVVSLLHFAAKVKRVIWLYQAGGPSHLETFDPSPSWRSFTASRCPSRSPKGSRSPSFKAPS